MYLNTIMETTQEAVPTTQQNSLFEHNARTILEVLTLIRQSQMRGAPLTYGPTPLSKEKCGERQQNLSRIFQSFTREAAIESVPSPITQYVEMKMPERFNNRTNANEENYASSQVKKEEYADERELLTVIDDAEQGFASPAELLLIRELLAMGSVELACVTHPYGERLEYVDEAEEAVLAAIRLMGGTVCDEVETSYRVKNVIGADPESAEYSLGLFMIRKQVIGELPDGTLIKRRSSFVLRTDEESDLIQQGLLTSEDIEAMKAVDTHDKDWGDKVVQAGGLAEIAERLLSGDQFDQAIPISSTFFAYNPATVAEIKMAKERERAERRLAMEMHYPTLMAAVALKRKFYKEGGSKDLAEDDYSFLLDDL